MDDVDRFRAEVASRHLHGNGIEIGAFGRRLAIPCGASVKYADRYAVDVTAKHHAMNITDDLVVPEIIDPDGTLACVEDGTLDFIAMCHVLEHCEDVIGTVETHVSKLSHGGVLFYVLPDKARMFDRVRDATTFDHLLRDHADGGASSRESHIREWCDKVWPTWDEAAVRKEVCQIHFHAWTANEQLRLWADVADAIGTIDVAEVVVSHEWPEAAAVLVKR